MPKDKIAQRIILASVERSAGPDDEPHDQKLHQHGRSADHRQIHLADPVQDPKYNSFFLFRLLIMAERIIATSTPRIIPRIRANTVTRSVIPIPLRKYW